MKRGVDGDTEEAPPSSSSSSSSEFSVAASGVVAVRETGVEPGYVVAYLAAFLSAVLFSSKGIFAKKAFDAGASPESLLALRFGFALPVFVAIALSSSGGGIRLSALSRRDWGLILGLTGIGFFLSSLLDFHALRYISVGLERMVLYSYPALVVLLTAWINKRAPGGQTLFALAVSYLGLAVAFASEASFTGSSALLIGGGMVFAAAFFYAGFMVGAEHLSKRIGSQRLTAIGMLLCAALYLPLALAESGDRVFHLQREAYGWAVLMAVFGTIAPMWLFAFALKRIGATRIAMAGTAGAVAVLPLAALILGEPAGPAQWFGFALTVAGGFFLARQRPVSGK